MIYSFIKNLLFKGTDIKAFYVARLKDTEIKEKVSLKAGESNIDISNKHCIICLDPFCIAIWLTSAERQLVDNTDTKVSFMKGAKKNASLKISLIEELIYDGCSLLLCKITGAGNYHKNPLSTAVLLSYLMRNKTSTYHDRKVISALYSYPRKVIIVSYKDDNYCNIFPMDIQGYIPENDMYLLGLRTTNATLDKILNAKKVVVCDTNNVSIETVYSLGKHKSLSPPQLSEMPFGTTPSELLGFPIPHFTGSYKEIEIIKHRKMGYHMLMIGKVLNKKKLKEDTGSLYHIGFLQSQISEYVNMKGEQY